MAARLSTLRSIPGIGPLNAAALVATYLRGVFANSDAFIGMDVRQRESGSYKGKRKLTKRGEADVRRLLYCATQPARSYPAFGAYYLKQIGQGVTEDRGQGHPRPQTGTYRFLADAQSDTVR